MIHLCLSLFISLLFSSVSPFNVLRLREFHCPLNDNLFGKLTIYTFLDIIKNPSFFPLLKRMINELQGILAWSSLVVIGMERTRWMLEIMKPVEPINKEVRMWLNKEGY